MSVDVFGRSLDNVKSAVGSRGPPGEGFKLTSEGQYDMDYHRLCNLADAEEENDAVSVKIVRNMLKEQINLLYNVTSSLDAKMDEVELMIQSFEKNVLEVLKKHSLHEEEVQEHLNHYFEVITQLDGKLTTLFESTASETKFMLERLYSIITHGLGEIQQITGISELVKRNSEIIYNLDSRLNALENGQQKSNSSRGTP